jgi:hypothetical protein
MINNIKHITTAIAVLLGFMQILVGISIGSLAFVITSTLFFTLFVLHQNYKINAMIVFVSYALYLLVKSKTVIGIIAPDIIVAIAILFDVYLDKK